MDEKNDIKPDDIEEYHFTETPEQDVYATEPPVRPTPTRFNRRNILLAIGGIVVLLVLYKIGSLLVGSKTTAVPNQPTQVTQPTPAISTFTPTGATATNNDQLADIQTQTAQNKAQLETVQNQLNTLTNSVTTMQNNLASITTQLQVLTSKLEAQGEKVIEVHPKPLIVSPPRILIKKLPTPYFIQAMIPGRAWLITPHGHTVTVSVGDHLFGYGTIIRIVPTRGIVMTSSGAILRYK
jgi:intracellular multiplication protein IcmG